MIDNYIISLYHDTRRVKKGDLFPVKLRVFDTVIAKTKYYSTRFNLSVDEFTRAWGEKSPRGNYKDLRLKLLVIETDANHIAKEIKPFSIENFDQKFLKGTKKGNDVFDYYDLAIKTYKASGQIGTGDSYRLSKKSIQAFLGDTKIGTPTKLSFYEITVNSAQTDPSIPH